jgi:hypothetical protein
MNFAKQLVFSLVKRNSGRLFRRDEKTTISEGATPGLIVRSQEPNEAHTMAGMALDRY